MTRVLAGLVLLLLVAFPVHAGKGEIGVGVGYTMGTGDSDAVTDKVDFVGATIHGSYGLAEHWELSLSSRVMVEDDLLFSDYEYFQIAVHAFFTWRPAKLVRPRLKLGLASTDAEVESFFGDTDSDRGTSLSGGGGLEVGRRWSGFLDVDYTEVELFDEDVQFPNVTLGVVYRFGWER